VVGAIMNAILDPYMNYLWGNTNFDGDVHGAHVKAIVAALIILLGLVWKWYWLLRTSLEITDY